MSKALHLNTGAPIPAPRTKEQLYNRYGKWYCVQTLVYSSDPIPFPIAKPGSTWRPVADMYAAHSLPEYKRKLRI